MVRRLRIAEFGLLFPASAVALAGAAVLLLQLGLDVTVKALLPAVAAVGMFLGAHAWLVARRPNADQTLLPLAATLTALGLTIVTRVEPDLGPRQTAWLAISLLIWGGAIAFPRRVAWLGRYRYSWAVLGVLLVASTLVLGIDPNNSGVRIWLGFGGYYFQPSELIKVLLVMFMAGYLNETRELIGAGGRNRLGLASSVAYLLPLAVMCGVALGLLLVQRDLGPAFLFFSVTLAMLYLATGRVLYVAGGLVAFVVGAFLAYRLVSVARVRFDVWFDPWSDAAGRGYQVVQGLIAFANGGLLGTGIGYGHPEILPAAHTDFPFAVVAEELGLFGAAAVVGVFVLFSLRGYAIAARATDGFSTLLAAGLTTAVSLQAVIILAGNLKLLPLTGITLPFVSYGGSSLVTNFLILALLHRISAESD